VAGFPELREALKSVEQLWKTGLEPRRVPHDGEDDEEVDEDEDEEPLPSMQVRRSFTGAYTIGISWEARASFADALKRGDPWNTLKIETGEGPAVVTPTTGGYRLTISPGDASALEAAVRVGDSWRSPEGETCVEVWGRPR
jgi:hypothetical protein